MGARKFRDENTEEQGPGWGPEVGSQGRGKLRQHGVVQLKSRKCQEGGRATFCDASGPPSKMRSEESLPGTEGTVFLTREASLEERR